MAACLGTASGSVTRRVVPGPSRRLLEAGPAGDREQSHRPPHSIGPFAPRPDDLLQPRAFVHHHSAQGGLLPSRHRFPPHPIWQMAAGVVNADGKEHSYCAARAK